MIHGVDKSLTELLVPIDKLIPLDKNPRKGNMGAIIASYKEFGQVRPLVGIDNGDGTITIIAGNHQLEAAKRLGWTHVAVAPVALDDKKAVAFALTDNRTTDLATTDEALLYEMLSNIITDTPDLMEALGWDEYEVAAIEVRQSGNAPAPGSGFTPPVLLSEPGADLDPISQEAATVSGADRKPVIQHTIVFESSEQQKRWYAFLRWLSRNYEGETMTERLLSFINDYAGDE